MSKYSSNLKIHPSTTSTSSFNLSHSQTLFHPHPSNSASKQAIPSFWAVPDSKKYENAPEIKHLKLHRTLGSFEEKIEDENRRGEGSESRLRNCWGCWSKCLYFIRGRGVEELDDLDPVKPRTAYSLDFIRKLATLPAPSKLQLQPSKLFVNPSNSTLKSSKSTISQRLGPEDPSQTIKRKAYQCLYDGLSHLHEINRLYKQLILTLTFTRYAEAPLKPFEIEMTHARTILGCYTWLATFITEQIQNDNEQLYVATYPSNELIEIVRSMEKLVSGSVHAWKSIVGIIEAVEKVHENLQQLFADYLESFAGSSGKDALNFKQARHIRVRLNYERRAEELEKLKDFEGFRHSNNFTLWKRISSAPHRILYKELKQNASLSWRGLEVLCQSKKLGMVKLLMNDGLKMYQYVQDQLEIVRKAVKSGGRVSQGNTQAQANPHSTSTLNAVANFEDGLNKMQNHLDDCKGALWSQQEIKDFIEVEKIAIDNFDLLTVGTATVRALLHDARHIIHICYEMFRDMDFKECKEMPSYEEVVSHALRGDGGSLIDSTASGGSSSDSRGAQFRYPRHRRQQKHSLFDVDERNLDQRDVESKFEHSIYQDILKELPVFSNNFAIAFTLQEAEGVFSASSHEMLSTVVHE